ncbi:protein spaetzle 4 isoform X2 [Coccinella septempunctata]|nr:protein spaetzle 4 isoform X2 [Coccinella septempunctata]
MHKPPCNLATEGGFCKDAGDNYPWQAVKRFVKENRGLMRRMYGEQPEGNLLREELARMSRYNEKDRFPRHQQPSDLENELFNEDAEDYEDLLREGTYYKQEYEMKFEGRYMRDDDVMRTKFIYSEEPTISIKLAGLKTAPLFRQATTAATTTLATDSSGETTTATPTSTTTSSTGTTSEMSQSDVENTTVVSSREADEVVESTTDFEQDIPSTTIENEKTKATSPTTTQETVEETSTRTPLTSPKPNPTAGVLFQDMEEAASDKVKLNFKVPGLNACPVKEEVVAPFWANNTRGEVLALLNMYPFEQYVHWEKCSFENKQMYCREGCRCEQQYRLHRLLAYDPKNECKGIFSDWFRFPSCCVCKCYGLPSEFRVTSRSPRSKETHWYDTGTVKD